MADEGFSMIQLIIKDAENYGVQQRKGIWAILLIANLKLESILCVPKIIWLLRVYQDLAEVS